MRINPKTEQEVSPLLKAGTYDFTITNAIDKQSRAGNDMIELHMEVFTETGSVRRLKDWLLEAVAYKLRHFFYAVGKGDLYESGQFNAADCIGASGKVKLAVESQEGYQDKNVVRDYEKMEGAAPAPQAKVQAAKASAAPVQSAGDEEPPF